jgi:hypothetical protein
MEQIQNIRDAVRLAGMRAKEASRRMAAASPQAKNTGWAS